MTSVAGTRLIWQGPGATVPLSRRRSATPGLLGEESAENVVTRADVDEWLGDDGGPGDRDGLHAYLDDESVGAVMLPPVEGDALSKVLSFAMDWPQLFLVIPNIEPASEDELTISRPVSNAAVLRFPRDTTVTVDDFVRQIEARDFVAERPRASGSARSWGSAESDPWSPFENEIVEILSWRCLRGLERSLDRGTRWAIFEPATPDLLRRIDRDVRGFLHRLVREGLVESAGFREVDVRFESDEPESESKDARLVVRVQVEFAPPYGDGLARAVAVPSSLVGGD